MDQKLTLAQVLAMALEEHQKGNLEKAKFLYEKILEHDKNNPDALHLLGVIAYAKKDYSHALEKITQALNFKTSDAGYYLNLGLVQVALGNPEKALEAYKTCLEIDAHHPKAYLASFYLGTLYEQKAQFPKALAFYTQALESNPDFYDAYWNRALIFLLLGRFEEGWKDYEFRFKKEKPVDKRIFQKPLWKGDSFQNKTLLISYEQGLGDNLQFIRYIPLVKKLGGKILLETRKELLNLFKNFPGVDELVEFKENLIPPKDFDFYIPIMSLPRIFNAPPKDFPNKTPYLFADPEFIEKFNKIIPKNNKLKVGLVWAGNPLFYNDKNRTIDFKNFEELLKISEIEFFSLQKGKNPPSLLNLTDLSPFLEDFRDTAAAIENLDLIITVDTSVAHLAGAMNKPVWVLLPFFPDWRYGLQGSSCLWYPSMRLFRQEKPLDWNPVFLKLEEELLKLCGIKKFNNP